MSDIKSILVQIDGSKACTARLRVAGNLADRFDAELSGLFVDFPVSYYPQAQITLDPAALAIPIDLEFIEQKRLHEQRIIQQRAYDYFQESGRRIPWRTATGTLDYILANDGRYHDLIIVSRSINKSGPLAGLSELAVDIAIHAGLPVLMLPNINEHNDIPTPGQHILIAWNGSREATRALHDSLPFLRNAQTAEIFNVIGDNAYQNHANEYGALRRYLQLHDIDIKFYQPDKAITADDAGSAILERINQCHYDLIIMGAYSHSKLRELFLGGMTRDVLKKSPVPVLLSH